MSNKLTGRSEVNKTCRCAIYTRKSTEEGLEPSTLAGGHSGRKDRLRSGL
jgi:hypothetical protein